MRPVISSCVCREVVRNAEIDSVFSLGSAAWGLGWEMGGVDGGRGVGASKAERSIGGAGGTGTDTSSGDIADAISSVGMSICSTRSVPSSFGLVAAEGSEGNTGVVPGGDIIVSSKEV
jgi:hypothetical protein